MLPADLSLLAGFLLVAEEKSFTRAARRQGVSPSAVSHAMRTLQEEFGVRLLARTTRTVALTDAGRELLNGRSLQSLSLEKHVIKSQDRRVERLAVSVFCCCTSPLSRCLRRNRYSEQQESCSTSPQTPAAETTSGPVKPVCAVAAIPPNRAIAIPIALSRMPSRRISGTRSPR
jgi:molybdenum-dependent DNA-binding transcriptional regulator ModE